MRRRRSTSICATKFPPRIGCPFTSTNYLESKSDHENLEFSLSI